MKLWIAAFSLLVVGGLAQENPYSYQPSTSICFFEAIRKLFFDRNWIPSCKFFSVWKSEQCDNRGNCWCVNTKTGQPIRSKFHRKNVGLEVDCDMTISTRVSTTSPSVVTTQESSMVETPPLTTTPAPTTTRSTTTAAETTQSTPPTCPENQVFSQCAGCGVRCVDRENLPDCVSDCNPRCMCPIGTYLNGSRCVTAAECPPQDPRCNETMVYSECGSCVKTCDQRGQLIACTLDCKQGCTCPPDTYMHKGRCVPEDQCPPPCPENQVYSYCASCDKTCADSGILKPCNLMCQKKCTCPTGMFLNGQRCLTADECP